MFYPTMFNTSRNDHALSVVGGDLLVFARSYLRTSFRIRDLATFFFNGYWYDGFGPALMFVKWHYGMQKSIQSWGVENPFSLKSLAISP